MNINQKFDNPLAAFSAAGSAISHSTNAYTRHLAGAVGYLAQALTQQNLKLDRLLTRQAEVLERLGH